MSKKRASSRELFNRPHRTAHKPAMPPVVPVCVCCFSTFLNDHARRARAKKNSWLCPGSNWGLSACKADAITN